MAYTRYSYAVARNIVITFLLLQRLLPGVKSIHSGELQLGHSHIRRFKD